jgi:hypothetical protein
MREKSSREQIAASTPKKVEVVIAAKQAPEKDNGNTNTRVEKVIAEAKKNAYANNSRKAKSTTPPITPLVEVPSTSLENANDGISLRSIEIQQKKEEALNKQLPSALSGKVAGLKINANNLIRGVVYSEDKLPIPGASVKFKGAPQSTVTDEKGQFSLRMDSILKDPKLSVMSLGFVAKEIDVKKNENLAIVLKPNNAALNEVVVTGYGAVKKESRTASASVIVSLPAPVGGWDKFEEYVVNNNKLLVDKKLTGRYVTVSFDLRKRGNPSNLQIQKRLDMIPQQTEAEEKEAIRLIKNGPKWVLPPNSGSSPIHTSVNIRF